MSAFAFERLPRQYVDTCLGRVCVRICGAGEPLLFWSSLLMSGRMWAAQAEQFAGRYRVILVDPPGHGDSQALTAHFSFEECVRCLVELLDALGIERTHYVGNSWGGMIGATFAALHPERLGGAVLMNCTASPAGFRQRLEYPLLAWCARLLGGIREPLVRSVVRAFAGPTSERERPQALAHIREAAQRCDMNSVVWAVRSVVPRRPDQLPLLARVRTPVLVVAGEEDRTFPVAETRRMAEAIPGAQWVVLPGTAHLAALENPRAVNALIGEFLSGIAATAR